MKKNRINIVVIMVILLYCCMFCFFITGDVIVTARNGISLLDATLSGRLNEFYVINENICISKNWGDSTAYYDIPIYVVFAVWNIPNYIYEVFTGNNSLDSVIGLLWAKTIVIPFLIGTIFQVIAILKQFGIQDNTKAILCTLTSSFFYTPIIIMGQYDIIPLYFMIKGLGFRLKEKNRAFCYMFAIAICFKPFALIVLLPILLLRDKSLKTLCCECIRAISLLLVCKIIQRLYFESSTIVDEAMSGHFLNYIFQCELPFFYGSVSIFVFAYLIFLMYIYFLNNSFRFEDEILVGYVGYSIFVLTSLTHPQWIIYLLPFSVILILISKNSLSGLLIDTVISVGVYLAQVSRYSWLFCTTAVKYMILGKVLSCKEEIMVID